MKHFFEFLAAGFLIGLSQSPATAADLSKIQRTLNKKPTYQTKEPKFGLLVFGSEAKIRVWVVLDGDVMYLDRNGNGDLTEPDKRVAAEFSMHYPDVPRPELATRRQFNLEPHRRPGTTPRKDAILTCAPRVSWFHIDQEVFRDDYVPPDEPHRSALDYFRKRQVRVAVLLDHRKFEQDGYAIFADRPEDAPIIHFDGPLSLAVDEAKFGPLELRRGETSELYIKLVTPGLEATTVVLSDHVPDSANPLVEIVWPGTGVDRDSIRSIVQLKERC